MNHRTYNCWFAACVCIFVSHVIPTVLSCILLLNGWMPLTVYERTGLADIVVSGYINKAFKNERTTAMTYSAEVHILAIYKGEKFLRDLPKNKKYPNYYNVSNFGERKMCYADVMEGESYIFFLTVYQQGLSAQYHDIFGAVAEFTEENEEETLAEIGWDNWSSWSPCSASCDGGDQTRQRGCNKNNSTCDGEPTDRRQCNSFACKGVRDLLTPLGVIKRPLGVAAIQGRQSAYNITSRARLFSPLSSIFRSEFPMDFSIIFTALFPQDSKGYLFTVSDIMGKQRIALKYGEMSVFEYLDQNGLPGIKSPSFEVAVADGRWHHIAYSVKGDEITMFYDCEMMFTKPLIRSVHPTLGTNLMVALGPYFARYGLPFEGGLEQLVIIPDSDAARRQCYTQDAATEQAVKDDGRPDANVKKVTSIKDPEKDATPAPPKEEFSDWSSWSACSSSCGKGSQTRTLYCRNNQLSLEDCVPDVELSTIQTRLCFLRKCEADCRPPCLNGGTCTRSGKCICSRGYYGQQCEIASCYPGCRNGGHCEAPDQCACPAGFEGHLCEKAICEPPCMNGGRCITPGFCSCPYGYIPPNCQPFCSFPCHNGGKCIRHNMCKCRRGYTGQDCTIPVCRKGCAHGGKCVAPNKCSCPLGYSGARCHKAICNPSCKNNGKCIYPNVCKCKNGFNGPYCVEFVCKKPCLNGGSCVGPNQCACEPGFAGRYCQKERCKNLCVNGGRCKKRRCQCPAGFYGKRCERRDCRYEKYSVPYTRSYRKLIREEYATKCGPWRWKTCVQTRIKYMLVSKVAYRTDYRCV